MLFLTYKWAPISYSVTLTRLERLGWDKHSALLGPFVSYGENKCCEYSPITLFKAIIYGFS
jgi:hypothetical protein